MNFPSISLKYVLVSFGCLFVAAVIFVSILGENNNGVNAARIFLTAVKERDHAELQRSYARNAKKLATTEESTRYHFLVELALLDHFELLDANDYRIDLEADSLWLPFISDRYLALNLRLTPVKDNTLFTSTDQPPYIERAILAVREDGRWKIEGFNLKDSELKNDYERIVDTVNYDKYIAATSAGITLKQETISLGQMSGLDRKVFIHSLENAIETTRRLAKPTGAIAATK